MSSAVLDRQQREVYTPLGKGKVVYELPSGAVLVQFDHGGGELYRPEEVFAPAPANRTGLIQQR